MGYKKLLTGVAVLAVLLALGAGQARADITTLDFTQPPAGGELGNVGFGLNYAGLSIFATKGFTGSNPIYSDPSGTIYVGTLSTIAVTKSVGTGLGVQDAMANGDSTIDSSEALIFYWSDPSVLASSLRLNLIGLPGTIGLALLYDPVSFGDPQVFDFNDDDVSLVGHTLDLSKIGGTAGHTLGLLAIYTIDSDTHFGVSGITYSTPTPSVPEPAAIVLLATMLCGVALSQKCRRTRV